LFGEGELESKPRPSVSAKKKKRKKRWAGLPCIEYEAAEKKKKRKGKQQILGREGTGATLV